MSKGFASDTGSSHRWLAGLLGRSVGSLPSAGLTRLQRYYEPVRPCASHRYSAPQGSAPWRSAPWRSPLASRRQGPTFRTRASRWSHAVFMLVAARPVGRLPPSFVAGQQREPGFGDVPTLSTRQQRFTRVRLTSAHLTGLLPPFAATLTTSAIGPTQLAVVWTLILQSEPEGPTLISCAARLPGVARYISHLLAPSWRTIICVTHEPVAATLQLTIQLVQNEVRQQGREGTALRGSLPAALEESVVEHACRQIAPDEPEHPPVRDTRRHGGDQTIVVHPVEELGQVDIHDEPIAVDDVGLRLRHRLVGGAARPEAEAVLAERWVPQGLEPLQDRLLDHAINHGGDAEVARPAGRLRDGHPTHRLRLVAPLEQLSFHLRPARFENLRQLLDGDPVDAGGSLVAHHRSQSCFYVVWGTDRLHEMVGGRRAFGFGPRHDRFDLLRARTRGFTPAGERQVQLELGWRSRCGHETSERVALSFTPLRGPFGPSAGAPACRVGGGRAFALPPSARSNGSCGFPASRFPVWSSPLTGDDDPPASPGGLRVSSMPAQGLSHCELVRTSAMYSPASRASTLPHSTGPSPSGRSFGSDRRHCSSGGDPGPFALTPFLSTSPRSDSWHRFGRNFA